MNNKRPKGINVDLSRVLSKPVISVSKTAPLNSKGKRNGLKIRAIEN